MQTATDDGKLTTLGEKVERLEQLARHHRAHINALEALLLQALPPNEIDDVKIKEILSALLPNQLEAERNAVDRVAVLLKLHNKHNISEGC